MPFSVEESALLHQNTCPGSVAWISMKKAGNKAAGTIMEPCQLRSAERLRLGFKNAANLQN